MNKKANIAIVPILSALFLFWFWGMVFDEVEPVIEDALLQLDNSVVCPPEFASQEYEICIAPRGEVIVNGVLNQDLNLKIDSVIDVCLIKQGTYNKEQVCILKDLGNAKNIYLTGLSVSKLTSGKKLLSYTKKGKYIKFFRLVKYIPK
ncbi:MAG TPA: hypothetical protein VMV95_01990 [Bacillota bacterium]|nr:hypothetical protein [Bacillota bacterium]